MVFHPCCLFYRKAGQFSSRSLYVALSTMQVIFPALPSSSAKTTMPIVAQCVAGTCTLLYRDRGDGGLYELEGQAHALLDLSTQFLFPYPFHVTIVRSHPMSERVTHGLFHCLRVH